MSIWERRYRRWIDAVLAGTLDKARILLIDDGSPVLPAWPDTDIITVYDMNDLAHITSRAPVILLRFMTRLGRNDVFDFPGWYRSYACGIKYAVAQGAGKIIHLESDAYVISRRLAEWMNSTDTGWRALWSPIFEFPEMAIQVINPDQFACAVEFVSRPYAALAGISHEHAMPFTDVEKRFVGDRYGEGTAPVPAGADFATQVPGQREATYYWWLNGRAGPLDDTPDRIDLNFAKDGSGTTMLGDGWSQPERKGTWMVFALSILRLPLLPAAGSYDLVITAVPHVIRDHITLQRLTVCANWTVVGEFDLAGADSVGCTIAGEALRGDGTDRLRFWHPDASRPARFQGNDMRILSMMVHRLSLQPRR